MKTLSELNKLWGKLGDVPINEDEEIDISFLHFPKGTDRYTIWHWFEEQNDDFSVAKAQGA